VRKARKGVLITTSEFTSDAVECVKNLEQRVVLIDGKALTRYMIQYDVGVAASGTYTLKRLDQDFFQPDD
jgi:restriction system protein